MYSPPQGTRNSPANCPQAFPPQPGQLTAPPDYNIHHSFPPSQQNFPINNPPPQQGYFHQHGLSLPQPNISPNPNSQPFGYQSTLAPPKQHVAGAYSDTSDLKSFAFSNESIRRTFIREVYSLLSVNRARFDRMCE